jgi:hypothetical protein
MNVRDSRLFTISLAILLLGAGCAWLPAFTPATSTPAIPVTGAPSPEGFVAFREGFGLLPGTDPASQIKLQTNVSVRWAASLPPIPLEVTVIRRRRTMPDTTLLQNITTAAEIPAGMLQQQPAPLNFLLSWTDGKGYAWKYDATQADVAFASYDATVGKPSDAFSATETKSGIVATFPTDEALENAAKDFLISRGALSSAWGDPAPAFSWNEWWKNEQSAGRCMTNATLTSMRALTVADGSTIPPTFDANTASCVLPQFPGEETISFSLRQDNQDVYDEAGAFVTGARIIMRTDFLQPAEGSLQLTQEADRSDYVAIDQKTLIGELRAGGLRGFKGVETATDISIESFDQGLYRYDVELNGETRTFFIPAIRMNGWATLKDGSHVAYSSVVPLVKGDQYRNNSQ